MLAMGNIAFADATSVASANYADIAGNMYESQLREWIANGFIKGYPDGNFKPHNQITRSEFIALVNRAYGFSDTMEINYSDVTKTQWYYKDAAKATKAGFIQGANGKFMPLDNISRQEMAIIISRLTKNEKTAADDAIINKLVDNKDIPVWSQGAISTALRNKFFEGFIGNAFEPTEKITRLEAVVVLDRAFKSMYKGVYASKGTYGPDTGIEILDGDVVVVAPGVTIKNTTINGNLILRETVGEGNVYLDNVIVKGETLVKGGGANSIVVKNSTLGKVIVIKEGNIVRIVASGSTTIDTVNIGGNAKLEEYELTGAGFNDVLVLDDIPEGANVIFEGNFDDVQIDSSKINVAVESGTIGTFTLAKEAENTNINIAKDAKVTTLTLNAAAKVTGTGSIGTANINVSGTSIEQKPSTVKLGTGVNATVNGSTVTPAPAPVFGGGGGGGGYAPPANSVPVASNVTISGENVVGKTLTGNYTYTDADNNSEAVSTYRWYRSNSATGDKTLIAGATSKTYTIQAADKGKYLFFEITPAATSGLSPGSAVVSAPSNKIIAVYEGTAAATYVVSENFNTHLGTDYRGINVGYKLINLNNFDIEKVEVKLFNGTAELAKNTSIKSKHDELGADEKQFSTPFIVVPGTYREDFWTFDARTLSKDIRPTKAVITIIDKAGDVYIAENSNLVEPNGASYVSLFDTAAATIHETAADYNGTNRITVEFKVNESIDLSQGSLADVIIRYGTKDANGNFVDALRSNNTPIIKSKLWSGYLNSYDANNHEIKYSQGAIGDTRYLNILPADTLILTTVDYNFDTMKYADSTWYEALNNGNLFVRVEVKDNAGNSTVEYVPVPDERAPIIKDVSLAIDNGLVLNFNIDETIDLGTEKADIEISYFTRAANGGLVPISNTLAGNSPLVKNKTWSGYLWGANTHINYSKGTVNDERYQNVIPAGTNLSTLVRQGYHSNGDMNYVAIDWTMPETYVVRIKATDNSGNTSVIVEKEATVINPNAVVITNLTEMTNAIKNQADGQTWYIKAGTYDIPRDMTTLRDNNGAIVAAGGQSGWYMPITVNNLNIIGIGNPVLTSSIVSTNGAWASQNFITVWGDNVKFKGLTITPKVEANKSIEVVGDKQFTIEGCTFTPNTIAAGANPTYGGSLYFNGAGTTGNGTKNISVSNNIFNYACISFDGVEGRKITISNNTFDNIAEGYYAIGNTYWGSTDRKTTQYSDVKVNGNTFNNVVAGTTKIIAARLNQTFILDANNKVGANLIDKDNFEGYINFNNLTYWPECKNNKVVVDGKVYESPYKDIDAYVTSVPQLVSAVTNAKDGDTILVASGNYILTGGIVPNKSITLVGKDKASTIIDTTVQGLYGAFQATNGHKLSLENMTFKTSDPTNVAARNGYYVVGTGLLTGNTEIVIQNCIIDGYYSAVYMNNADVNNNKLSIVNNTITNCDWAYSIDNITAGAQDILPGNLLFDGNTGDGADKGRERFSSANIQVLDPAGASKGGFPTMQEAANAASAGDVILVATGNYELGEQLKIMKPITIKGIGIVTITPAAGFNEGTYNADKHLISINGVVGLVQLENLTVSNARRAGINVWESTSVTLKDITSINNAGTGLIVTNSNVVADNLNTSGNAWGYGVNVDNGSNPSPGAPLTSFTLTSGTISDIKQIVSDKGGVTITAPNYQIFINDVSKVFGANITGWYGEDNAYLDTSVNFNFDSIQITDINSVKFSLYQNGILMGTALSNGENLVNLLKDCAQYWEKTADTYTEVKGIRIMSSAFKNRTEANDNGYWLRSECAATNTSIPNGLVVEVVVGNTTFITTLP